MSYLHVFDMDGTLLKGSACFEISRSVGVLDETLVIEDTWIKGDISDNEFWIQCLPLWKDLDEDKIDHAFSNSPWLEGVEAVFADIQARNEHSVVISQSPEFFVERLHDWGLDHSHGAIVTPGDTSGASQLVSSKDKLRITENLITELGLSYQSCVAYGDSSSDLDLFQSLPNSVAVNAKEQISNLASVVYEGPSIWEGYLLGRELLKTPVESI
jgi:phosphoserine phosphatase